MELFKLVHGRGLIRKFCWNALLWTKHLSSSKKPDSSSIFRSFCQKYKLWKNAPFSNLEFYVTCWSHVKLKKTLIDSFPKLSKIKTLRVRFESFEFLHLENQFFENAYLNYGIWQFQVSTCSAFKVSKRFFITKMPSSEKFVLVVCYWKGTKTCQACKNQTEALFHWHFQELLPKTSSVRCEKLTFLFLLV